MQLKQIIRREPKTEQVIAEHLHPVLRRLYQNRGINNSNELERGAVGLLPFSALKGIRQAVQLLTDALQQQQHIVIVGDFDADGATSTAVLMAGLKAFGFKYLEYMVPNRFEYGYGLTPELAELVVAQGAELIITVDNGISAVEGVALAKKAGVKVLVTDHHLAGSILPNADAIVNPNQPGCDFPSKALAGVGVAFYLLMALRAGLRDNKYFADNGQTEPNIAELLDLVALGTVADVVPLDSNNRILVHQGLMRIRSGKCRPGIQALIDVANRRAEKLTASDFGFSLAPRLNAAGRLDDMALGISCLLAPDLGLARQYAAELDALNVERRAIEQSMQLEAQAFLSKLSFDGTSLPECLCLYRSDWHQGVIGILAGRIKEQFHRPTIVFAEGDNGELKGSARSIPGLHIRDLLEEIASQYPGLIKKFGGHAMAAGLTIAAERLETFQLALSLTAKKHLTAEQLTAVIYSDGELDAECFDLNFARLLQNAGPWGQAFPEPVFDGEFTLLSQKMLAERHLKLMLQSANGLLIDAIWFNADNKTWPDINVKKVHLAYQLDINEYREQQNLQLIVRYMTALS
ncbi:MULTISPECIES: single-stranded-DNA-specific exonuclease RecJ [unclassified Arsukibacterium]|uniref:single-stranded-DNA-specific exonuclease RecJ n=1 Tax=unclassified Arsukibacterium TaxID=2635278 RepID=UPI000C49DE55|nr:MULTISPECIES: single-stranded-DNA-specific exonuclease RecJ [unclassified Arsukibacterium]MAA93824.1 single-stranded-DNA-specific exonuclease RecJ [Rheinheimera sp.]MBM34378.1 single-stranded-DNA-specific exonuclease RecJ [Rheinheimera sp.]HAW92096.1 single-stranded-DNA-specific exonuclease RecJ [Candidatus Azambacteria bacterium]